MAGRHDATTTINASEGEVGMAKQSYWQLLKHPKWQKKRLEVLERAGFKCEACRGDEVTLHVHHTYYEKGKAPWDYPSASLIALCEFCHESHHMQKMELDQAIGCLGADFDAYERLIGYVTAMAAAQEVRAEPQAAYIESHILQLRGIADFFGLTEMQVYRNREDAKELDNSGYVGLDFHRLSELKVSAQPPVADGIEE